MQIVLYALILIIYIFVGLIGLVFCLFIGITESRRSIAKRLAGGIIGSYPGVFIFQFLSLPFIVVALLFFLGVKESFGEPSGVLGLFYALLAISSIGGTFTLATFTGFFVGWGCGYRYASGMPFKAAIKASNILTFLFRLIKQKKNIKS